MRKGKQVIATAYPQDDSNDFTCLGSLVISTLDPGDAARSCIFIALACMIVSAPRMAVLLDANPSCRHD